MSPQWSVTALVVAVGCYTAATLLLADAAAHSRAGEPGSLARTLRHPAWWLATCLQGAAFLLLVGARHMLPLLLVQPAVTSALATAAVGGAVLGRWRLSGRDVVAVTLVVLGVALTAAVARPGPAQPLAAPSAAIVLLALAGGFAVLLAGLRAGRHLPAVAVGMAAGLAFGAAAVAGRAWAIDPFVAVQRPGTFVAATLTVLGTVVGQLLLSLALTSGHVGGPLAGMYAVQTAAPALAGVLLLGDRLTPGGGPVATLGVGVAITAAFMLAGHGVAEPAQATGSER